MIDILLKYILWYEFFNDLDVQSDFDKNFVTKKVVKWNHSYLKYAVVKKHSCISSVIRSLVLVTPWYRTVV